MIIKKDGNYQIEKNGIFNRVYKNKKRIGSFRLFHQAELFVSQRKKMDDKNRVS
ncbi:hypothetical protein AB3N02_22185 [Priestia aryabhattai]|uniref:hypothetical protein n=1 Tax=Priestia aryabhattai TaxID=412384 RepID=UPI00399F6C75